MENKPILLIPVEYIFLIEAYIAEGEQYVGKYVNYRILSKLLKYISRKTIIVFTFNNESDIDPNIIDYIMYDLCNNIVNTYGIDFAMYNFQVCNREYNFYHNIVDVVETLRSDSVIVDFSNSSVAYATNKDFDVAYSCNFNFKIDIKEL